MRCGLSDRKSQSEHLCTPEHCRTRALPVQLHRTTALSCVAPHCGALSRTHRTLHRTGGCAHTVAGPTTNELHTMARGPMKRGKPLSAAQASAIVDYLRQNATAPGVPLESLSQLLCDACSDSPHSFFEEWPVRLILRSRALLLKEAKCAPSVATHWSNKKKWSSAYEKAVRAMWDKLQMNMNGPRRSNVFQPYLMDMYHILVQRAVTLVTLSRCFSKVSPLSFLGLLSEITVTA